MDQRRRNIAENFSRLSRAQECYRQTTDGRATAYSERKTVQLCYQTFLSSAVAYPEFHLEV